MTVKILDNLPLDSLGVIIFMNRKNQRLSNALASYELRYFTYSMKSLHSFTFLFRFLNIFSVISTVLEIKRNKGRILLIQGSIEHGFEFVWAARLLNVQISSYIPLTNSFRKMGFKFSAYRDFLSMITYRLCNHYFVISNSSREKIAQINPAASVELLRNFVDLAVIPRSANKDLGCLFNVYLIGRIVFSQKGQDGLVEIFRKLPTHISEKIRLNFIGDGVDFDRLQELSQGLNIEFHGWRDRWWEIGGGIDLVVINSKFEGVPLVMLEAIALGIPIVAPNIDGIPDYLPVGNLFCSKTESDQPTLFDLLLNIFSREDPREELNKLVVAQKDMVFSKEDIRKLEKLLVGECR